MGRIGATPCMNLLHFLSIYQGGGTTDGKKPTIQIGPLDLAVYLAHCILRLYHVSNRSREREGFESGKAGLVWWYT